MENFNETVYKYWDLDPMYCTTTFPCKENDIYLMKGDERVRIIKDEKNIQVEKSNINNPNKYTYVYFTKTKTIHAYGKSFYHCFVGTDKEFNINGLLVKQIDWDKPYKFSIEDLIKKIKNELNIDLMDISKKIDVTRSEQPKPVYTIMVPQKPSRILRWIKVDGTTGEIMSDEVKTPPNKYSPDWNPLQSKK